MVKLLEETVDVSELNISRAGIPNPELVPIIDKLIERIDSNKFTVIEVKDKKESERTAESIRGQLRARKYRVTTKTGTKIQEMRSPKGKVLRDEDGRPMTEVKMYLYMCAYSPVKNPEEEVKNGTTNSKPKNRPTKAKSVEGTNAVE